MLKAEPDRVVVTPSSCLSAATWHGAELLIRHAQRVDHGAIGFLTAAAIADKHKRGRILVARANEDQVAWATWGIAKNRASINIYQCWTREDARRLRNALALVETLNATARVQRLPALALWCAADLEAVTFWQALGFHPVAKRKGGARRHRLHVRLIRPVTAVFNLPPAPAATIAASELDALPTLAPASQRQFHLA